MTLPRCSWRVAPITSVVTLAVVMVASGCGTAPARPAARPTTPTTPAATSSPTATSASTGTSATSAAPATSASTTTVAVPPDLQGSGSEAAATFISDWKAANKAGALRVATSSAVTTLFATPYAGQTVVDRGCSDQFPPFVCSYGPSGGGTGSLYEISVGQAAPGAHGAPGAQAGSGTQGGSGWYVTAVVIES